MHACMHPQCARSALATARHQLLVEKPDIHARMEHTVQQAKIAQGNRKYHMDSLGEEASMHVHTSLPTPPALS
jgi:hypothetical protein